MKWLLRLHRGLSGVSLLLLTVGLAGIPIPFIAVVIYGVIMVTLVFYLGELLLLSIIALTHPKQVDVVYPLTMLLVTAVALKATISGNILLSAIPVTIMFIFGYIGEAEVSESESNRVHKSEQSR